MRFDVLQQEQDATRFTLYEVYRSPADFAAHQQTPHYFGFREAVADWMAEPREGVPYVGLCPAVTRFLGSRKVPYQAFETPVEKLGALDTARILNVPPEVVFKTIVVTRNKPKKPLLAVVPGPWNVDLKRLAAALGEKKVHLPTEREAEQLTGLQAGGISPLALINKGFQVVLDASTQEHAEFHVSGG